MRRVAKKIEAVEFQVIGLVVMLDEALREKGIAASLSPPFDIRTEEPDYCADFLVPGIARLEVTVRPEGWNAEEYLFFRFKKACGDGAWEFLGGAIHSRRIVAQTNFSAMGREIGFALDARRCRIVLPNVGANSTAPARREMARPEDERRATTVVPIFNARRR
jgi:hypothetical protein